MSTPAGQAHPNASPALVDMMRAWPTAHPRRPLPRSRSRPAATRHVAALRALPVEEGRDQALGYLATCRAQISYREFMAAGWPIGSGCVESAGCPLGDGDRASPADGTGHAVVALRAVATPARWSQVWPQIVNVLRTAHRSGRPSGVSAGLRPR